MIVRFSEEKRREVFGNRYLKISLTSVFVTVLGIIVTTFMLPAKECKPAHGLVMGAVCRPCEVTGCVNCWNSGVSSCDECELGTMYAGNQCVECDGDPDMLICRRCQESTLETQEIDCIECNRGFRKGAENTHEHGQCLLCDDKNCLNCDEDSAMCLECAPGFYLEGPTCAPCSDNCLTCSAKDVCTSCKPNQYALSD